MRPGGKEGFGYKVAFGTEIVGNDTDTLGTAGFYQITAKAESSNFPSKDSGIDGGQDLAVNDIFYDDGTLVMADGDKTIPITLTLLGFAKDVEGQSSKQKHEDTTQEDVKDGYRSYSESALSESTGSVSGYYETNSDAQEEIENHFKVIIKDDGTNITRKPVKTGIFPFMLSRRETTETGEIEVWEYKPMIVDQLTQRKPMDGTQEFNFNYTVDGKSHPRTYKRTVPAA